jgi:hypothetical protein
MTAVATLDKVTKRYGKQAAVNEVTLELGSGQCIALVGHNGAGKTTLIKMMLGLTHATAGRIRVLGEDPLSQGGQRARLAIGYLPESVAFPPSLTGREMLRFYARLKRRPVSECDELLARVGLVEAAHKRIGAYSKGMRQRPVRPARPGIAPACCSWTSRPPPRSLSPSQLPDHRGAARPRRHGGSVFPCALRTGDASHRRAPGQGARHGHPRLVAHHGAAADVFRLRFRNGWLQKSRRFDGVAAGSVAADGAIELSCAADRKMEVLRRA